MSCAWTWVEINPMLLAYRPGSDILRHIYSVMNPSMKLQAYPKPLQFRNTIIIVTIQINFQTLQTVNPYSENTFSTDIFYFLWWLNRL